LLNGFFKDCVNAKEVVMSQESKLLYTAKVHTTGGREGGESRSEDGRLEIKHSIPGAPGNGTNPEQLFAAGWSTCFESAMLLAAGKRKIQLPKDLAVDAEIDLLLDREAGYSLRGRLNVSLPGVERGVAQEIVDAAEGFCPYSKAIRGNVETKVVLV
jgi:osmotically inducible protein OsmC